MAISIGLRGFLAVLRFSNSCFVLYLFLFGIFGRFLGTVLTSPTVVEMSFLCIGEAFGISARQSRRISLFGRLCFVFRVCRFVFRFFDIQWVWPTSRADPRG